MHQRNFSLRRNVLLIEKTKRSGKGEVTICAQTTA